LTQSQKLKRHRYTTVFLIAFITNVLFSIFFPRPLFVLDAEEYHIYATNMLNGQRFEVFPDGRPLHPLRPPMYPIFIALIYFIFGSHKLAVYLSQIILTSIISMLIYYLSKKIFKNDNSAFIASILFSFHLPTLISSAIYYPEILFTFILFIFVISIFNAFRQPSIFRYLISGFLMGLTALVKPVVQFLPLIILPALLFHLKTKKWKGFLYTAILIFSFLTVMVPWIIRNYNVYKTFIFCDTTGGINLYTSNFILQLPDDYSWKDGPIPPMTEEIKKMAFDESIPWPQKDKIYYKAAVKLILEHPMKMMKHSLKRVVNFFTDLILKNILFNIGYPEGALFPVSVNNLIVYLTATINIIYIALALCSIIFYSNKIVIKESLLLFIIILYFTGIHSLSNAFVRYSTAIFPYIIIFSGHCLSKIFVRTDKI
jgi:hypothetical protein